MLRGSEARAVTALLEGPRSFTSLVGAAGSRRAVALALRRLLGAGLVARSEGVYGLTPRGEEVGRRLAEVERLLETRTPSALPVSMAVPHPLYGPLLARYVSILRERFGPRLRSVVLFGSVARGRWTKESDIDLLVVAEGFDDPMRAVEELQEPEEALRATPEYRKARSAGFYPVVEPHPMSPERFRRGSRLLLDVVTEGRVLHDDGTYREGAARFRGEMAAGGCRRVEMPDGGWYWILGGEIGRRLAMRPPS